MSGVRKRRRRWAGAVVVAAVAVLIAAAAAAATGLGLPGGKTGGQTHDDLPPSTAAVTRQTLVDTETEDGTLGYGDTTTVSARLAGTVTRLPAAGASVRRGQALYHLDNSPIVLLYGSLPAYRILRAGVEGADVEQFERNLTAMGYSGFTVDDEYSASTAAAVRQWQDDLGLPETGVVELGRVVYAPGVLRVDADKAAVGDVVQPGTALLTYTGSRRLITVELEVTDQRLATKGAAVNITLPDGKTTAGKIAKAQTVIITGDKDPETKIEVTIGVNDEKKLGGLGQAAVDVAFTASQRKDVLTVPVAALLALAEGGYGLQVVEGTTTRIVAVKTGLFADGRVEVTGDGLTAGMTVGVPS